MIKSVFKTRLFVEFALFRFIIIVHNWAVHSECFIFQSDNIADSLFAINSSKCFAHFFHDIKHSVVNFVLSTWKLHFRFFTKRLNFAFWSTVIISFLWKCARKNPSEYFIAKQYCRFSHWLSNVSDIFGNGNLNWKLFSWLIFFFTLWLLFRWKQFFSFYQPKKLMTVNISVLLRMDVQFDIYFRCEQNKQLLLVSVHFFFFFFLSETAWLYALSTRLNGLKAEHFTLISVETNDIVGAVVGPWEYRCSSEHGFNVKMAIKPTQPNIYCIRRRQTNLSGILHAAFFPVIRTTFPMHVDRPNSIGFSHRLVLAMTKTNQVTHLMYY